MRYKVIFLLMVIVVVNCLPVIAQENRAVTSIHIVVGGGAGEDVERWRRLTEAFEGDRPGYTLDVQFVGGGELEQVTVMIAAGTPPDVFRTIAQHKMLWAEQNLLLDLTPYWEKSDIAQRIDIFPFMMEAGLHDGKIVGVPFDYSNLIWIINQDVLGESGLAPPERNWTVEDFREYAIRMTRPDRGIYGTELGAVGDVRNWQWSLLFTDHGWLSEDFQSVLVETPGYIDTLEYWLNLVQLGAAPMPQNPPARDAWSGGYGMWQGWIHYSAHGRLPDRATYDWTMAPMPSGAGGNEHFAHGHIWSMPINAEDPSRGWVFLEWLLSPEGQAAMVELDNRQPLTSDYELWERFFRNIPEDKRAVVQSLLMDTIYEQGRIRTMNYWPTWPNVSRVMTSHLRDVFNGVKSPNHAMSEAATEMRAIMSSD